MIIFQHTLVFVPTSNPTVTMGTAMSATVLPGLFLVGHLIHWCSCSTMDPGKMFKLNQDSSILEKLNPLKSDFIWNSPEKNWAKEDDSCSMGAGIVLKRIVRKLFNHLDALQPHELDEEFIYRSSLSYEDYLSALKFLNSDQLNCASLHDLDSLLSKFITEAEVRRPSQMSFFQSTLLDVFSIDGLFSHQYHGSIYKNRILTPLTLALLVVIVVAWILRKTGYSRFESILYGVAIVGLIQYFIQQESITIKNHTEKQYLCSDPGFLVRTLDKMGIDYYDCRSINSRIDGSHFSATNVAFTLTGFLTELVLDPLVKLYTKVGEGSQSFLNSFSGFNWLLAPVLLVIIYILGFKLICGMIVHYLVHGRSSRVSKPQAKLSNSSRAAAINNSPRRSSIEYRRNGSNSAKKKNK